MLPDNAESAAARLPMSASQALRQHGAFLTQYEKKEVMDFEAVHYVGQRCTNKVMAPTNGPNNGYDTDEGEYIFRAHDHIAYRYEMMSPLGSGAFGQVFKAIDHADGSVVAVKFIRNQRKVLQQAEQEIQILAHLNERDGKGTYGVVRMTDHFQFRGHICITYELLGMNLYDYLKARDFHPVPLMVIRGIAARMLVTLTFMARENVMHCDLKPENVLLRDDDPSLVKVVDLGSASFDSRNAFMYIQSRFYRAPEVIMEQRYSKAIDWWSFGCILCELANGDPVFPGEDEKDQLGAIMEFLGPPPESFVNASSARRKREFFSGDLKPLPRPTRKGKVREPGSRSLAKFLGVREDDEFLSFVRLFLQWNSEDRTAPREAMRHPWISAEFVFPAGPKATDAAVAEKEEMSTSCVPPSRSGVMSYSPKLSPTPTAAAPLGGSFTGETGDTSRTSMSSTTQDLPSGTPATSSEMTSARGAVQGASLSNPLTAPPTAAAALANADAYTSFEHYTGAEWFSTDALPQTVAAARAKASGWASTEHYSGVELSSTVMTPSAAATARSKGSAWASHEQHSHPEWRSTVSTVRDASMNSGSLQERRNDRPNRHRIRRSTNTSDAEVEATPMELSSTSTSEPHRPNLDLADPPSGAQTHGFMKAADSTVAGAKGRAPAAIARALDSAAISSAAAHANGHRPTEGPSAHVPPSGAKASVAASPFLAKENAAALVSNAKENAAALVSNAKENAAALVSNAKENAAALVSNAKENAAALVSNAKENAAAPPLGRKGSVAASPFLAKENAAASVPNAKENAAAPPLGRKGSVAASPFLAKENAAALVSNAKENAAAPPLGRKGSVAVQPRGAKDNVAASRDTEAPLPDSVEPSNTAHNDASIALGGRNSVARSRVHQLRQKYDQHGEAQEALSPRKDSDTTIRTLSRRSRNEKTAPSPPVVQQSGVSDAAQRQLNHHTESHSLSNGATAPGRREYSISVETALPTPRTASSQPPTPAAGSAATGRLAAGGRRMLGKNSTQPSEPAPSGLNAGARRASDPPAFAIPRVTARRATVRPIGRDGTVGASAPGCAAVTNATHIEGSATAGTVQPPQLPRPNSYRQRSAQVNVSLVRDGGAAEDSSNRAGAAQSVPQQQALPRHPSSICKSSSPNGVDNTTNPEVVKPLLPPLARKSVV